MLANLIPRALCVRSSQQMSGASDTGPWGQGCMLAGHVCKTLVLISSVQGILDAKRP